MTDENIQKYGHNRQNSILRTIGIAALSAFIGVIGYQAGKSEGQAELYRTAAYHIVDTNRNGVIEDAEFSTLAKQLLKYEGSSVYYDSAKVLTHNEIQRRVDNASNLAWKRFVDDQQGLLGRL